MSFMKISTKKMNENFHNTHENMTKLYFPFLFYIFTYESTFLNFFKYTLKLFFSKYHDGNEYNSFNRKINAGRKSRI